MTTISNYCIGQRGMLLCSASGNQLPLQLFGYYIYCVARSCSRQVLVPATYVTLIKLYSHNAVLQSTLMDNRVTLYQNQTVSISQNPKILGTEFAQIYIFLLHLPKNRKITLRSKLKSKCLMYLFHPLAFTYFMFYIKSDKIPKLDISTHTRTLPRARQNRIYINIHEYLFMCKTKESRFSKRLTIIK